MVYTDYLCNQPFNVQFLDDWDKRHETIHL